MVLKSMAAVLNPLQNYLVDSYTCQKEYPNATALRHTQYVINLEWYGVMKLEAFQFVFIFLLPTVPSYKIRSMKVSLGKCFVYKP